MSRVDVVVPCYNYGRFLRACVDSVLQQRDVAVRVLIIDDASPDDTADVAAELVRDARVEYRRHEKNRGHIATYNEGLAWATADYCLLLSADDLLAPAALARAARILEEHPEIGLVSGRQIIFEREPPQAPEATGLEGLETRYTSGADFIESVCLHGNPVATPTAVVRARWLKELGGYKPRLPHTADMELWLRFATRGGVAAIAAVQAFKRDHGRNMQIEYVSSILGDLEQRWAAFDLFFAENRAGLPEANRLEELARHTLAMEGFWHASRALDAGDTPAANRLLDFSLNLYPRLRSEPCWSRLVWKRRLGKVWCVMRPVAERIRRGFAQGRTGD